MKKLYNCNARCDENTLISYNTVIFEERWAGSIYANIYPSKTTLMHIRKYIQWLKEQKQVAKAKIIQALYNCYLSTHKTQLKYYTTGYIVDRKTDNYLCRC